MYKILKMVSKPSTTICKTFENKPNGGLQAESLIYSSIDSIAIYQLNKDEDTV